MLGVGSNLGSWDESWELGRMLGVGTNVGSWNKSWELEVMSGWRNSCGNVCLKKKKTNLM